MIVNVSWLIACAFHFVFLLPTSLNGITLYTTDQTLWLSNFIRHNLYSTIGTCYIAYTIEGYFRIRVWRPTGMGAQVNIEMQTCILYTGFHCWLIIPVHKRIFLQNLTSLLIRKIENLNVLNFNPFEKYEKCFFSVPFDWNMPVDSEKSWPSFRSLWRFLILNQSILLLKEKNYLLRKENDWNSIDK